MHTAAVCISDEMLCLSFSRSEDTAKGLGDLSPIRRGSTVYGPQGGDWTPYLRHPPVNDHSGEIV